MCEYDDSPYEMLIIVSHNYVKEYSNKLGHIWTNIAVWQH